MSGAPGAVACPGSCYRRTSWPRTHRRPGAHPARRRGPAAVGVADHVPSGDRRPRPVHQRVLVDPADGGADPRGPPWLRRPRELPRHRPRRRRPGVPRPARPTVPRVRRRRPRPPSRRSGSRRCRRSCSSASTARSRPRPKDGTRRSGARSPRRSPTTTAWQPPDIPIIGDPGPFHGTPALGVAGRVQRSPTSRSSRSSSAIRAALAGRRRAVVSAPPGAGKTTIVPLALLDAPWRGDGRIVMLEPRRLGDAGRGPPDGRAGRHGVSATSSATRPATSAASGRRPDRGAHRGRADPAAADATPSCPASPPVIFDEVHERNLTDRPRPRALARRRGDAAARPAHPGDVGDRRHGPFARLLGAGDDVPAPVVAVAGRTHPVDVRWLPRQRNDRMEAAVERAVHAGAGENDGRRARVPARHRRDHALPRPARRTVGRRRRCAARSPGR